MKISSKQRQAELDFDAIVKDLIAKYGTIFFANIDGNCFLYKPLSRKDYKAIVQNDNLASFEKEDEVCAMTILWPENVDWDEIEAGIPSRLYKEILENSFLDGPESIARLIDVYRDELELLDTQMSCIISEAFPNYDIEEIEEWDMIKFCKMFTRAEWKLKNLRKLDDMNDVAEYLRSAYGSNNDNEEDNTEEFVNNSEQRNTTEINNSQSTNSSRKVKVGTREMTEDEFRQYQEMQRMFPEIDWGADAMFTGYDTQTVDTRPVALR